MDRKQKEALILALAEKGVTYREITRKAGVSPNTIKAVLNKAGLDQNTSISSRVFELYSQQKSPLQVAIALGLKAEEAIHYHQEYFMLLGCTEFTKVYLQIKDNPWPYVNLVKLAQDAEMSDDEVVELLRIANRYLPAVRMEYNRLKEEKNSLEANVEESARTSQEISDQITSERRTLEQFRVFIKHQQQEIERLYSEKKRLEDIVERFRNSDETYTKIKGMVKEQIEGALSSPKQLLRLALTSMMESSRKNPGLFQALHYNMPSTRAVITQQSFLQSGESQEERLSNQYVKNDSACEILLLEQAELIYNQMLENSANTCINQIINDTESPQDLVDTEHDQSVSEEKPTSPHALENELITTIVVSDTT